MGNIVRFYLKLLFKSYIVLRSSQWITRDSRIISKFNNIDYCQNSTTISTQESGACLSDPNCVCALDVCYMREQVMEIDNCWFIVPSDELDMNGTINVTVFNQALLINEMSFEVGFL